MLDYEQTQTGDNPEHCIIWLHGLGADGNDFLPIVPQLCLPQTPAVRFIFPHAPMRAVSINNGSVMRAWYDVVSPNLLEQQDSTGIQQSQRTVLELIQQQLDSGITSQNIILAGFSQGGAIALHTGLRFTQRLGGIIALSTYLPLDDQLTMITDNHNQHIPILMAHGTHDPVIPMTAAIRSRQQLVSQGYAVQWHEYPMQHSVCEEEINHISEWLIKLLH
ncbi:MAG: alpha/beta hydrolase [Gammaproteobacteria bacterium]|nr:alpha/beta hydrolase [Gammaproteobacteria bacterium]